MVTSVNGENGKWHSRFVSYGMFTIALTTLLIGFGTTITTILLSNEHRLSEHEREIALAKQSMQVLLERSQEQSRVLGEAVKIQNAEMQKLGTHLERITVELSVISTELAVFERSPYKDMPVQPKRPLKFDGREYGR